MANFLVVFDRARGRLLSEVEYLDYAEALEARFRAEKMHRGNGDIEIVVLSAASSAALRHTHSRYYQSVGELARGLTPGKHATRARTGASEVA